MVEKAPFQIREFPVELREAIVKAAKDADLSVSEFMTGVCLAAREAGWMRVVGESPPQAAANGLSNESSNSQDVEKIAILTTAICQLASARGIPKTTKRAANRTLEQRIASYALALPAPEEGHDA